MTGPFTPDRLTVSRDAALRLLAGIADESHDEAIVTCLQAVTLAVLDLADAVREQRATTVDVSDEIRRVGDFVSFIRDQSDKARPMEPREVGPEARR